MGKLLLWETLFRFSKLDFKDIAFLTVVNLNNSLVAPYKYEKDLASVTDKETI